MINGPILAAMDLIMDPLNFFVRLTPSRVPTTSNFPSVMSSPRSLPCGLCFLICILTTL
jgi:hypothetical protein